MRRWRLGLALTLLTVAAAFPFLQTGAALLLTPDPPVDAGALTAAVPLTAAVTAQLTGPTALPTAPVAGPWERPPPLLAAPLRPALQEGSVAALQPAPWPAPPRVIDRLGALRALSELAPRAVRFAAIRAGEVSVVVLDLQRRAAYGLDAQARQRLASLVKVPMLLAALEAEGRGAGTLLPFQRRHLRAMIVVSDNWAAASILRWLGGTEALRSFLGELGLAEPQINVTHRWGESGASAHAVAALFAELALGERISAATRTQALALLAAVIPEQRWGVSAGLEAQRPHWRIALKNGWYPTTAGGWRVNSAGLISDDRGEPRYVIAVLTAGQPDLDYGIATIEEITRRIYAALADGRTLAAPR